jgi:ATP-binding cassette, subfamily D (ALD), member 4
MKESSVDQPAYTKTKTTKQFTIKVYLKLLKYSLKNDIVAGIFIFGWICTLLSVEILSFQFGSLTASFYSILPSRNSRMLTEIIVRFCTFLIMMSIGKGSLMASRGLLSRAMRRNLTQFLHEKYISLKGLKAVQIELESLDCPDQRMTEDVEKFTIGLLEIVEIIFMAPILIFFYTVQVSRKMSFTSIIAIYSHFGISLIILRFGMKKLKDLTVEKEKREANFRNEHVSLRNSIESFIFLNSPVILSGLCINLNSQLKRLLFTSKALLITESVYELTKTLFSFSGALLNFLLMAMELSVGVWRDEKDPARIAELISMTSFVSLYLIFQLSKLASVTDLIGSLNGQVTRLSHLVKILEEVEGEGEVEGNTELFSNDRKHVNNLLIDNEIVNSGRIGNIEQVYNNIDIDQTTVLEFKNFTASVKDKILYENFNLKIRKGENVIISGSNGTGKTSLLRFITGLWPNPNLNVYDKKFMSCPQNFVLFTGSLNDLLGIKLKPNDILIDEESEFESFDKEIIKVLDMVGLKEKIEILKPFHEIRSISLWKSILTPGQHQRLSLARALIHQPPFLILDETFLPICKEEIENILKELEKRKITLLVLDPTGHFNGHLFKEVIKI